MNSNKYWTCHSICPCHRSESNSSYKVITTCNESWLDTVASGKIKENFSINCDHNMRFVKPSMIFDSFVCVYVIVLFTCGYLLLFLYYPHSYRIGQGYNSCINKQTSNIHTCYHVIGQQNMNKLCYHYNQFLFIIIFFFFLEWMK